MTASLMYHIYMIIFRTSLVFGIIIFTLFFIPHGLTISFNNISYKFSNLELLLSIVLISLVFELFITIKSWFYINFQKPRPLKYLKKIIENIIIQDTKAATKYLNKLTRMFGPNNEIITWISGYLNYYTGNNHLAKSNFYKLIEMKDDLLGGFSLFQIAKLSNDKKLEFEALSLLKQNKNTPSYLIRELGDLQILNQDYEAALSIFKTLKDKRRQAVIYFLKNPHSMSCIEKAYELCKEIPAISIVYADKLYTENKNKKKATQVLSATWEFIQVPEIFKSFITITENDIKAAEPLLCESFVAYSEFGKLALNNGLIGMAYEYLMKAFKLCPTLDVYDLLSKIYNEHPEFEPPTPEESFYSYSWICQRCHTPGDRWHAICPVCNTIDAYAYQKVGENHQLSTISHLELPARNNNAS